MGRSVFNVVAWTTVILMLPLLLAACRSQSVRTVARIDGIEVLRHVDRRVGTFEFLWYTVRIDGVEVAISEPWYETGQRRFQRVDQVRLGEADAVVVKVLGVSRESAYSHFMTFLLERDGQGGVEITRLSPVGAPNADGLDIHWPIPEQRQR